ncbi:PAS-domain containing protein [Paracoccus sp. (in: a-proteobacteria)]|uniref:hybrid sensor histidine kinase/response regulator n=1 Tax=Paracoccus sp. TaxID=267 RepID=UPI0026E0B877|nr:PAS-domain containing protein [Paracoccus sp. (in: a-proteobacteria)]MDO5648451.1 PAS-domain containing protein [Paracoccus sp. (in: a-proteobacteria)]
MQHTARNTAELQADMTQSGLNLIAQALSIFDADLRLAVSNRQFQTMFDLPDDLTRPGTDFADIIAFLVARGEYGPQDDPDAAITARVEQARAFQPHYIERERPNGRWVGVEGAPLSQGGWITVYTDITDVKHQETLLRAHSAELSQQVLDHAERLSAANRALAATNAALHEAQRILTQTQARTRQVIEMIPAHIAHMAPDLRYTFSNRRLASVFPGASDDVVGLTMEQAHDPATHGALLPFMQRAQAGEPQLFEVTHPASGRRIRISLTPAQDDGGGVYILSTDITDEVQTREALAHASRRNLAAQLTSGVAHDFGNLLTIILGLQARLAAGDLPPDAAGDVQATLAAARRGAALLNRLSQISGGRDLAPEPTDLPALLAEIATLARPSLADGVVLDVRADLPGEPLLLDPGALHDSVLNLILNANAAMAGPGTITLSARQSGQWLVLSVTDTGPGFSPDALTRGTEPFFTTKGGQGSGLGLSMVYDQTKRAGGTMRLDNTATGAQVTLRLPWRPVLRQMVLLAEDDDTLRAQIRDQLTSLGHAVIEAATLSEARAITDLPGLTLILSDIQLGDGLGLDLTGGALPAVLMTSLPPGHPLRAGADCPVLTKPFTTARLAATLAEAVKDTP